MRSMSRFWMALVVSASLGMTLLWVNPVSAIPLSNTGIDWGTFLSWTDANNDGFPDEVPGFPAITAPYDFAGPNSPDGLVFSGVYTGTGPAAGLFVYVYQVNILTTSDVPVVNGLSLIFATDPTLTPVPPAGITSFHISSGVPTIGFGLGTKTITDADWFPPPNPTLDYDFELVRTTGDVSYIMGTFSPLPPTLTDATVRNAVSPIVRPLVYTPTPEPSPYVLLMAGLMGVGMFRWRHNRRKKV